MDAIVFALDNILGLFIAPFEAFSFVHSIHAARGLYNSSDALSGEARKEFQEMVLRRVAVLTVILGEVKFYYHLSDEQIRSSL